MAAFETAPGGAGCRGAHYARGGKTGGYHERRLVGAFGTETLRMPRVRIESEAGKAREWRSQALPRWRRLTKPKSVPRAKTEEGFAEIIEDLQPASGLFDLATARARTLRHRSRVCLIASTM